ncbi:MAG: PAS domain S-box protein [Gammaproteobacteria bacterium]|nr:PAS domain S-box protein [Gammaproteobacteria bacterium]
MNFRSKNILGIAIIQIILLLFIVPSQIKIIENSHIEELLENAETTTRLFATLAITPAISNDIATLEQISHQLTTESDVRKVKIVNGNNQVLASSGDIENMLHLESEFDYLIKVPIGDKNLNIGHIEAYFSSEHLRAIVSESLQRTLIIGITSLCIAILFAYTLGSYLSKRLKHLEAGAKLIGEGQLGYQIDSTGQDEIARTIGSFNQMSRRINELYREQKRINKIFLALNNAQNRYIAATSSRDEIFSELLSSILELTSSQYGFIGEVLTKNEAPYLHTYSITNIAWDDDSIKFYNEHKSAGFEFFNLNTLFGATLHTGLPVISNNPKSDNRAGGLPKGHPPLDNFLGMPLYSNNKLIGMIGLANRDQGFSHELIDEFQALWNVSSSMILATQNEAQRARMEEELRESEERFALVAKGTNDGMWDWDLNTGHIYFSSRWKEMLGYTDEELANRFDVWQEHIHPEDLSDTLQTWTEAMEGRRDAFNFEYRVQSKQGQYLWIRCRGTVFKNTLGRAIRMAGSHTDVTKEKENELALKQNADRTRAILDNVMDVIMMLNEAGDIEESNPAITGTFFYEPNEVLGRNISELVLQDSKDGDLNISRLREMNTELVGRRRDGLTFPVEFQLNQISNDHQQIKYICVIRDITERKKTEQAIKDAHETALDAAKTKSEFLANMSHEIRTPLHGILGMIQMTEHTPLNAKQQGYLSTAHRSATHLLGIINDILDFSKIEAGKLELEFIPFNLRELLEDITNLYARQAHEKGILLEQVMPADLPDFYNGDPARLKQIFTNLVSNAIKFTDKGSVIIKVTALSESAEEMHLRIEVIDTGIGISKDAQAKIFESFQQADSTMARQYGGTGLGLAICKQLANLMNGEISIHSEPGKGSRFIFSNIFHLAQNTQLYTVKPLRGKRATLLDIEDSLTSSIIVDYLRHWNLEVDVQKNVNLSEHLGKQDFMFVYWDQKQHFGRSENELLSNNSDTQVIIIVDSLNANDIPNNTNKFQVINKPIRQSDVYNALISNISQELMIYGKNRRQDGVTKFSGHVLLVEDNPVNQEVSSELIRQLGMTVDIAANGIEAVEAVKRSPYDLVLMDCQMPEMDGYEATNYIRIFENSQSRTKVNIIALTANAMKGDREKCIAVGMNDYLSKPFTLEQLISTLRRWLPEHQENQPIPQTKTSESDTATTERDEKPMSEIIDYNIVNGLRSILKDRFAEMLEKFETNALKLVEDMKNTLSSGDNESLRRAAHTLKGSSGTVGAQKVAETSLVLEKAAKEGQLDSATEMIAEIETALEQFREQIPALKAA